MDYTIHPNTRLGPVKLKISQLERSTVFYRDLLGFQILKQYDRTVELTADGEHAVLIIEEVPEAAITKPRTSSGLYHFAILLPDRVDLGLILQRLIHYQIQFGQADHLVSEAIYISDPDLIGIEIYRDRSKQEWQYDIQGDVVMDSLPLDLPGLLLEGKDKEWSGMPKGTAIGHLHFHVNDLAEAQTFYCDGLGFEMQIDMRHKMGAIFISAGGYHHHIGLNIWAGAHAPKVASNGTGILLYTIQLPDEKQLAVLIDHLIGLGYQVEQHNKHYRTIDPMGTVLELSAQS